MTVALDIGGTKLEAGVVDGAGRVVWRRREPTPATGTADQMWAVVEELVAAAIDAGGEDADAIGVGTGGPMTMGGETVSPLNIPAWRGFPLRERLSSRFGVPVAIDNDAKALALAEGWVGAAVGCANYIAMVVSTGVGGGIVLDGRLLDGVGGNAGHIGHVPVVPGGRHCVCGAVGCLEAEASGTAIEAHTGQPAAAASDEWRVRTGELTGRAIGSVANLLGIELAVVGGSVALGYADAFFAAANRAIADTATLEFARSVRIVPAGCGADGPLVGAAAVIRSTQNR